MQSSRGVLYNRCFLKISQNSQENTFAKVSFLAELQVSASNFIKKKNPALVFSSKFCKIFKNTVFYRTPVAASVSSLNILILSISTIY